MVRSGNNAAPQEPGLSEVWQNLPFVTRHVGMATIAITGLLQLNPGWVVYFMLAPNTPAWQIWRYFTAPLTNYGKLLNTALLVYMVLVSLNSLETRVFASRSRTVYYLLFVSLIFGIAGPRLGIYWFLSSLASALTWTSAQEDPLAMVTIYVIPAQQRFLPFASVFIAFANGGIEGMYPPILGIVAAHAFMFFTELLPRAGGPLLFAATPRFLEKLDPQPTNNSGAIYGAGNRLGHEKPFWRRW